MGQRQLLTQPYLPLHPPSKPCGRWRRQQQQAEQSQLEQWQQWKHTPKAAGPRQAQPRPLSGASWEEATAADTHDVAEGWGEEEEPGLGELASWVGSAVRRTRRAVSCAASSAAEAARRRYGTGAVMAAGCQGGGQRHPELLLF